MRKIVFLLALLLCMTACVATHEVSTSDIRKPEIIDILPAAIDGFRYVGYQVYPKKSLGYSIRYQIPHIGLSDIDISPAPRSASGRDSKEIVLEMTKAAINGIKFLVSKGEYSDFQMISQRAIEEKGIIITRVEGLLTKGNTKFFTLLYVTESSGTLIKARITVNDNETNRSPIRWDKFISQIFGFITSHIKTA